MFEYEICGEEKAYKNIQHTHTRGSLRPHYTIFFSFIFSFL